MTDWLSHQKPAVGSVPSVVPPGSNPDELPNLKRVEDHIMYIPLS